MKLIGNRVKIEQPLPPAEEKWHVSRRTILSASAVGGIALTGQFLSLSAVAQTPPTTTSVTRSVIAETKLRIAENVPLYFRAVGLVIPVNAMSSFSVAADGILYQMSGSTVVTIGGKASALAAHEGVFIPAGKQVSLKTGGDVPSTLMHFMLSRALDLDRPEAATPATTIEVFRTATPIPGLKAGMHDLNLTLITFPPHMPSNPPHHRSGAALYYILSGTGANTVAGQTSAKKVGSVIFEPSEIAHQWGNPADEPLRFVVFNINPEGMPAVVPGSPVKAR
ncbi:MAG: cupin domain-containing protein [Terriglobales bacterium]